MKRILCLILALMAILSMLASCGNSGESANEEDVPASDENEQRDDSKDDTSEDDKKEDDSKDDTSEDDKKEDDGKDDTTEDNKNEDDDKLDNDDNNNKNDDHEYVSESVIREAKYIAGLSHGYAWVNNDTLCDETGKILGQIKGDYWPYAKTNSSGYTMMMGKTLAIADKKGTIVASEESLDVKFVVPDTSKECQWYDLEIPGFEDGYILTYSINETYSGVTYRIGILGTNGEWIVKPSSDHPILKTEFSASKSEITEEIVYLSDGIYSFDSAWLVVSFYDVKQNKVTGSVSFRDLPSGYDEAGGINFKGGRALWKTVYRSNTYYYSLTSDGTISTFLKTDESHSAFVSDSTYFISDMYFWVDDVLYSRETLLPLPAEKNQLYYKHKYINGLCPKLIKNAEGTTYFGLEHAHGYIFEPVKVPFYDYNTSISCDGKHVLFEQGNAVYIYDYSGKLINDYEIGEYVGATISNGVVRLAYISGSGNNIRVRIIYSYINEIPEKYFYYG